MMPPCRILSDAHVNRLLLDLSGNDIRLFQQKLEDTLRQFSIDEERQYQPEPGVVQRPNGQKTLFRPFTSTTSIGTKIIVHPAPEEDHTQQPLRGVLVMLDKNGYLTGIINAAEVTGFRTSLSAIIPFTWRQRVENIVVFGAGKQALWHLRLALTLRGGEIKSVTIVNRSRERAQSVADTFSREGRCHAHTNVAILDHSDPEYQHVLRQKLSETDVIFCTVPSEKMLFSLEDLNLTSRQQPYISAIGSWTPDMLELDPALLKHAVDAAQKQNLPTGLIVDDAESASTHSGEVLQSGLGRDQMLELGEVIDRRRVKNTTDDFLGWLRHGLVVYKSVGVGLTDKAAGEAILEMAAKHNIGTDVQDF